MLNHLFRLIFVFFTLFTGVAICYAQAPHASLTQLQTAEKLAKEGHFSESLKIYNQALNAAQLDKEISESHYRLMSIALSSTGKEAEAMDLLQERLSLHQSSEQPSGKAILELTASIMLLHLNSQNPSAAIEAYLKLPQHLRREGQEVGRLFLLLGEASLQLRNYPDAEYAYQLALMYSGDHFSRFSIIYRYATLLYEIRGHQQAIDLLSQLEKFNPEVKPEDKPLYYNDKAMAYVLYGRLLIEKAKAKPSLRPKTATKSLYIFEEAMKAVSKLPKTKKFQGSLINVSLEAGKAFEDMGYRDNAIKLYKIMDEALGTQSINHPLYPMAFWEVKLRLSQLLNMDKEKQAQIALARVNTLAKNYPAGSPALFAPSAELAWKLIDTGHREEARNLLFGILNTYAQHIEAFGTCDNGLDSLYVNNLLKAFTPSELLLIAGNVLNKLLIANIQGKNVWQSRNCRMALDTIMDAMNKFQHQFSSGTHRAERIKLDNFNVLAAELHRYSPMSHSLAIRKLKREAQALPFKKEFNEIMSIGEDQYRARMALRDAIATQGSTETANELSKKIEQLTNEHERLVKQIQTQYPDAKPPVLPAPVHPGAIMQHLSDNDAVIIWAVDDYRSKAIIITKDEVQSVALPIDLADMETLVSDIRKTLDQPSAQSPMEIHPYAMDKAYELYTEVFEPLTPYIQGRKNLYLLPDGPLAKLPLQVLPTQLPEKAITSPLDFIQYRSVPWLGDKYRMSYQPSLNNLFDQLMAPPGKSQNSSKRLAYAGFGNPVMPQSTSASDSGLSTVLTDIWKNLDKTRNKLQSSFNFMGDSTLKNLSHLPPLPKTEQQLRSIGKILGEENYIYTGKAATLNQLQELPLSRFQTLVFATHGLMAGKDLPEPGLVMTPTDETYSTAILDSGMIADLNLNADRVILSACNTAELGRDNGLASLSTAFFQAGAKSLLVSHWSTEQSATTELMVKVFRQLKKSPEQGLAPALQHAAQDMRDNHRNTFHAHPMFWAPFVAIGQDH